MAAQFPPSPCMHQTGVKSTGAVSMFRKEVLQVLSRSLTRSIPTSEASAGEALRSTSRPAPRGTRLVTAKAAWSSGTAEERAPSGSSAGLPPLAQHKPQLAQWQEVTASTNQANGFAPGRCKQRANLKKARAEIFSHAPSTPHRVSTAGRTSSTAELASAPPHHVPLPAAASASVLPLGPSPPATGIANEARIAPAVEAQQQRAVSTEPAAAAAALRDDALSDEEYDAGIPEEEVRAVYQNVLPPDVHVVNTLEAAHAAHAKLMSSAMAGRIFACDTEVSEIDVTKQSPCCHGRVICFSVYAGEDIHFGDDPAPDVPRSMLWVDTYLDGDKDRQGEAAAILEVFRPFFAALDRPKVWHNYSFDRHVLERAGLKCAGFGGDTMHMARMWDSSRLGRGGYGLEALSSDPELMSVEAGATVRGKVSMKKLFGRRNVKKDGTEGKLTVLPPVDELQRGEDTRWQWVNYSAYDAKSTWDLHQALAAKLVQLPATVDEAVLADYSHVGTTITTLWDVYCQFWRPFGELLTEMEAAGMAVDRAHLAAAEERAVREEEESRLWFKSWATSRVPDAQYMNAGSGPQVSQLIFAGVPNKSPAKPPLPLERTFKVPNVLPPEEGKRAKKTMDITLHSVWGRGMPSPLVPEVHTPAGIPACSTPVLKALAGRPGRARKALAALDAAPSSDAGAGLEAVRDDWDDAGGTGAEPWSTDDAEITRLQLEKQSAMRPVLKERLQAVAAAEGYGKLFSEFGSPYEGLRACSAVDSLVNASAIDTLLSNFIVPLQSDAISKPDGTGVHRVHCSLNINTETGRLSARRPNLQNQPALEKDRYKVRQAFTADVAAGKTLVVADYGQLELRILAHVANCRSMLEAFRLGGDFHSRTALGMYDHIQQAVAVGDCLLEWDGGAAGEPAPAPLLKDMFAAERRRAKVLNFSIAYGKTAHGLSKDWGVKLKEAEETVERWYADRPEVREWQRAQRELAETEGYVCTLLGRRRLLPDARPTNRNKATRSHALRAAINTPIQGSAADVATAAMLRIDAHQRLAELGWRLLLQVHDEVILEGPKESAQEAREVVIECMGSPFSGQGQPLRVELAVDSKFADTWYDAK